jgi:hypothetical protein
MFMEIPKKISVDLSTTTGTGSVRRVSGDGASAAEGKNSEILRNGATVSGSGKPEAAAGQALLGMMAGDNIVSTNGFFKGKIQEKDSVKDEATIETHAAAFLADGPEANGKFQKLMELASRGAESSSEKVSPREIKLGKQAVIPLDGPDAEVKALLTYAFSLADRQGPITTGAIINSFHEAQE